MSLTKKDRSIRSNLGNNRPNDFGGSIASRDFTVAIADAMHNDYSGMRSAVKIVARQTGANERAVKNWLDAKNGPSGEHLVALACHSDGVLETFLRLAGRGELVVANEMVDVRRRLVEMLAAIDELFPSINSK